MSNITLLHDDIDSSLIKESSGANIHFRGAQDMGKTMSMTLCYKHLIDFWGFSPSEAVGNLHIGNQIDNQGHHFGGKYGDGYQALKGDDLRQFLWDMTHKPYRHRIVLIDEIDSEFPARMFAQKEQTEIMLRLWHNKKLRNFIMYTSHLGTGTDVILRLATNFVILPHGLNWIENSIPVTVINALDLDIYDADLYGVSDALTMYDRWEMTEKTEEDSIKPRPVSKAVTEGKVISTEKVLRSARSKWKQVKADLLNS